jgi:transcriptional regulator NrdR family protein
MDLNDTVFNTLTCRKCGSRQMKIRTSMPYITDNVQTILRTRECMSCHATYETAEVDLTMAKDVLNTEDAE